MPENLSSHWDGVVQRPVFEEYAEKFKDFVAMTRRDGILELRFHNDETKPQTLTFALHNAWSQVFHEVGNDPENEVIIITGTGDVWMTVDPSYNARMLEWSSDGIYKLLGYDAVKLLENLLFSIDVPTIAAVNGPGGHTEFALLCDITLCAQNAVFFDPHFLMGVAPGDGLGLAFQELLGTKRSAYALYTSEMIPAERAVELGLVNEVLPADQLLERAWGIAEQIMRRPKVARRMAAAIIKRPWKRRLVDDFGFHILHESFGIVVDEHGGNPIGPRDDNWADYPM